MSTSRSLVVNVPRVHRRRDNISESLLQEETSRETPREPTLSVSEEARIGVMSIPNMVWAEFWKRVKIYPEQTESVSEHVSSRHRRVRNQLQSNAISDTESNSSDEEDEELELDETVVVVCRGCRDKQANQSAHMDYGGCLYMGVVN
jgi:hypothetical protein